MSKRARPVYTLVKAPAKKKPATAQKMVMVKQPAVKVVPGYTRTVGAYKRSLPGSVEKKYLDSDISVNADMTGGVISNGLALVPQGTTDVTRVGNKIVVKNLGIHMQVYQTDQTTAAYQQGQLRLILFIDKQCNGAVAGVTDILKTASILSFRNMDQVDRFIILKDKVYTSALVTTNAAHTSAASKYYKINKNVSFPMHFSSTTGAVTEIKSFNPSVLYITNSSTVRIAAASRAKFIDL